ncbi:TPA: hypothetical protein ACINLS_000822 [Streptococcus agalactiae]|nr:hypothetical protein [Streptococcus agalactiae]
MSDFLVDGLTKSVGDKTVFSNVSFIIHSLDRIGIIGVNGTGDSDIMMTDTINPLKSKFKGFHKTFKQDELGLSLSSFLLN